MIRLWIGSGNGGGTAFAPFLGEKITGNTRTSKGGLELTNTSLRGAPSCPDFEAANLPAMRCVSCTRSLFGGLTQTLLVEKRGMLARLDRPQFLRRVCALASGQRTKNMRFHWLILGAAFPRDLDERPGRAGSAIASPAGASNRTADPSKTDIDMDCKP